MLGSDVPTMNPALLFERADGYLYSQFRAAPAPAVTRVACPFITLSREAGSGGSSLARILARRLNASSPRHVLWRIYDENLITRMLEANHLSRYVARYLPEDRMPEPHATIGELAGLHPNLWELVQRTNTALRELAQRGHAIIVGRGANFAAAGLENGVHVRLIGSAEHRAQFLASQYNIPEAQARKLNDRCEARRRRYVTATFGADVADPYAYDLVVNTSRLSLSQAADIIIGQVRSIEGDGGK